MKCLRKVGCRCKTCKKEMKFVYKSKLLSEQFSYDDLKFTYTKTKSLKYPVTPTQKEIANRKSMIAHAMCIKMGWLN